MSNNMKSVHFPKSSYEEWQEEAVKALKGKPFESLFTKTLEGITIEPLYTKETIFNQLGEALDQQVATIRSSSNDDRFATAQQIFGETEEQWLMNLQDSLARGNEVIVIDTPVSFKWSESGLVTLVDYLTEYPFKISISSNEDELLQAIKKIDSTKRDQVEGYIISEASVDLVEFPNIKTKSINTLTAHYNGANATQELAIALALANELTEKTEFKELESNLFVQFAIDTQYFIEIAKVRAFKVLWQAFSSGFKSGKSTIPVVAETSLRSYSKLDTYVNLLRAGNEALSAAIAGVDVFTVLPHDVLTEVTEQSIRIARNVSLVTKEESHVLNVIDPSGGSYFIESLTASLVKDAWALFLEIEQAGGLTAYEPQLKEQIEAVKQAREIQIATRKTSLIGTNIYANPKDISPQVENKAYVNTYRVAKVYEQLRTQYDGLANHIEIVTFGELKQYKPRADYVSGVFAVAGIEPKIVHGLTTIDQVIEHVKSTKAKYIIIVATDEDAITLVPEILNEKVTTIIEVAGKFKDHAEVWQQQGLNGFIYAGQNIVEKLQQIAKAIEEA